MREGISAFLEEKQGLSVNSKQSYKYDLEQFLDLIGERISETSLKIYQAQLSNFKISAQKRKVSACLHFFVDVLCISIWKFLSLYEAVTWNIFLRLFAVFAWITWNFIPFLILVTGLHFFVDMFLSVPYLLKNLKCFLKR